MCYKIIVICNKLSYNELLKIFTYLTKVSKIVKSVFLKLIIKLIIKH